MFRTMACAAALLSGLGASYAQEGSPEVEADEEVVVTVQLRSQRLLEVPVAVTAYSGSFLERLGITKFDDLSLFIPGLEVQEQSANNTGFVIRGITSDSGAATAEPRIAVFQDGVAASRNRGTYMELFDLERVEVARGPQATLFGRGALIGAVNVIQNKADVTDTYGRAEIGIGDYNSSRAMGMVNAASSDGTAAVRLAGAYRERDGFTENLLTPAVGLGGINVKAWRAAFAYQPTDAFRIDIIYNEHRDRNEGTPFKSGTYNPPGGNLSPFTAAALNPFAQNFEGSREIGLIRDVQTATGIVRWDLDESFTLTSVTGWREFNSREIFDADGSAVPLIMAAEDARGEQFSQELRLAFNNGGSIEAFGGVSFFHEEGSQRAPVQFDERYALAFASGRLPGPSIPSIDVIRATDIAILTAATGSALVANAIYAQLDPLHAEYFTNTGETDSWDVFADVTWKVTEDFELQGGIRYTSDDKTSTLNAGNLTRPSVVGGLLVATSLTTQATAAANAGNLPLALSLRNQATAIITALASPLLPDPNVGLFIQPTLPLSRSGEFDGFTWRFTARYALEDNISLWASYARGRTPEVLAITPGNLPGSVPSNETVRAETVDSYEIGIRGAGLADGTLDAEGSVYYYEYNDFQTLQAVAGAIRVLNAGAATAYGFEGALNWRPTDELQLFATYAYNHARFDSGTREGNHFRLSPDHSFSVGATYEIALGEDIGRLSITPSYTWQSKIFFDDNNDRLDLQPAILPGLQDRVVDEFQGAYGLFNVRVAYETPGGDITVTGFVNNIADEEYLLDAGNIGDSFTVPTFIRGPARTVGVEFSADF